ncbi:endonuclease/exonuclease/phosphatase family protein [Paenibacillus nasutitermitis]|uniref:Endonuclease n=1 Tax=Paenibacillus nasutitermitis TaxID=1652958 RepID=A0A917DPA1_9BACL|nr:endonuclease/exonuclease/phosphatase family protein [Paenibacillus nasutitermitis]GGD56935.1 endonuclease [Paenibacillus nasutitermitis]
MPLTLMSFNLRINVKQDGINAWPNRIIAAAAAIKESGAEVICTQEGSFAMLQELKAQLTDYEWIGEGRRGGNEDEHCAIFYRQGVLELVESGNFGLSERPGQLGYVSWDSACPRLCTWVRFRKQNGQEWEIFNTHLDHISQEARRKGIGLIVKQLAERSTVTGIPAVLAGDFNCEPDDEVIAALNREGFVNAYSAMERQEIGSTWHGFKGGETGEPIDYIFVAPEVQISSVYVDRNKYDDRYPSDHYPVIATLHI